MRRLFMAVTIAVAVGGLRADSLAWALQARARIGPDRWARVVEIENSASDPHHPLIFHALLFALEGRLWLYDSNEGTQSLSLLAGRLTEDEADPAPLLRTVLPHFRRYRDLTASLASAGPPAPANAKLPYGCFIECVARWRTLRASGTLPEFAGILAFYFDTSSGPGGHSVLIYTEDGRRRVFDPDEGATSPVNSVDEADNPLQIARAIFFAANPLRAHLLTLHAPDVTVAALKRPRAPNVGAALRRDS